MKYQVLGEVLAYRKPILPLVPGVQKSRYHIRNAGGTDKLCLSVKSEHGQASLVRGTLGLWNLKERGFEISGTRGSFGLQEANGRINLMT